MLLKGTAAKVAAIALPSDLYSRQLCWLLKGESFTATTIEELDALQKVLGTTEYIGFEAPWSREQVLESWCIEEVYGSP